MYNERLYIRWLHNENERSSSFSSIEKQIENGLCIFVIFSTVGQVTNALFGIHYKDILVAFSVENGLIPRLSENIQN